MCSHVASDGLAHLATLLSAALKRPSEERDAFLARACGLDDEMRAIVGALLNRSPATDDALQRVATETAALIASATHSLKSPEATPGPLDDARFAPGQIFSSRYRIVNLLGRGAMGEVYRAEDLKLGQPVALKLMSPSVRRQAQRLERFVAEVRLARGIAHPHVCRVYDIGEGDGWHYLSMELVDGETLASLLARIGRLPREKAVDIAQELCAGLAAAHARGVLHRDLKPSNIMIDGRGHVKIMDFGLAISMSAPPPSEIVGTPAYMAPEQLRGEPLSERSDVYALGLVLYEVFTGRSLFAGWTAERRLQAPERTPPIAFGPEVDPGIGRAIAACLSADASARPATALSIATALPGGDLLAASRGDGRLLPPEIVAASGAQSALRPSVAWALLLSTAAIILMLAAYPHLINFGPSVLPKPPAVLAERARAILAAAGHTAAPVDRAQWFAAGTSLAGAGAVRFFYRESPQPLVPANIFRVVSGADPPADVPGMATVTLDPSGRLLALSRIDDRAAPSVDVVPEIDWGPLFAEAGLDERDFERGDARHSPLVPQDDLVAWTARSSSARSPRVTAASFRGSPVYFQVDELPEVTMAGSRDAFATGRSATGEAVLWAFIALGFLFGGIYARRNLRSGECDRAGARRLALFVVGGGVLSAVLRAHHVAAGPPELALVLSTTGWALVWGGFSWLAYLSLEPHIRRWRPGALVSWTRVLSGRVRDPLVGRDVLIGVFAGACLIGVTALQTRIMAAGPPPEFLFSAFDSLASGRVLLSRLILGLLDGVQYALGGLSLLALARRAVGTTWLAATIVAVCSLPLLPGGIQGVASLPFLLVPAIGSLLVMLRVGLLAHAVSLVTARWLTASPLVLHLDTWYLPSSSVILLLVSAVALYGFHQSLDGRPAFGGDDTVRDLG
jgi:serine/threonine protein kinase